ncbi:MAG TPA: class I SAM-dependent methyltransferase [Desulfobacteraceae bacterium]|nr:class I SAM-dependent methyltransferase [Deltaproteobacteria bacterium]MBW2356670.1 class I SAM-dependent methyltransferase [Deltaproteobacteria bacterium]RLB97159.1 MAG: class I SAM-dependent methyltransferase [Deltaproteobacteria bacterium]HDI58777.1 class I SAM-dependent methyltransferase [Desulfobacteraceae bacterium]
MGYVFDFNDAQMWRAWVEQPANQVMRGLQCQAMLDLIDPKRLDSLLAIGCGTCLCLEPLLARGIDVTGIDPSPYMLDIARERFGHRIELHRGVAEDLPFDDNQFNHAVFFFSLEYVGNPGQALAEAFRVAKDRVFIGVWNRFSPHHLRRWTARRAGPSLFDNARFFDLWQIRRLVGERMGEVPLQWRSICQFSTRPQGAALWAERLRLVQHCPFGNFLGVAVSLAPRYRTRPLELTCPAGRSTVAGAGHFLSRRTPRGRETAGQGDRHGSLPV